MIGTKRLRTIAGAWDEWGLGGTLTEIADQIERERDAEVADSPYDAILPEDRETLAWVREHGGLDHVKEEWRSRVPYDLYERRRQRLLGHIAECETALGRRNRRIEELGHRVSDLTNENAELRRRAMPEGCEWPRYESGEPVQFGDDVTGRCCDDPIKVRSVVFRDDFVCLRERFESDRATLVYPGERVKRPAVLAADGEPLEVGQTVWHVDGRELTVTGLPKLGEYQGVAVKTGNGFITTFDPCLLTHQRPVLDADGVPIELGDDLYSVEGSLKLHVSNIDRANCRIATSAMFALDKWADPSMFTHTKPEPPDSWERIEEDALSFVEDNAGIPHDQDQMERDMLAILRRCRALAERERGE